MHSLKFIANSPDVRPAKPRHIVRSARVVKPEGYSQPQIDVRSAYTAIAHSTIKAFIFWKVSQIVDTTFRNEYGGEEERLGIELSQELPHRKASS